MRFKCWLNFVQLCTALLLLSRKVWCKQFRRCLHGVFFICYLKIWIKYDSNIFDKRKYEYVHWGWREGAYFFSLVIQKRTHVSSKCFLIYLPWVLLFRRETFFLPLHMFIRFHFIFVCVLFSLCTLSLLFYFLFLLFKVNTQNADRTTKIYSSLRVPFFYHISQPAFLI